MNIPTTFIKTLGSVLVLILTILMGNAQTNQSLAYAREKTLDAATTPSDSIKVLLDVYNLSDRVNRDRIRVQLINLAQRSDNHDVINAVLKELSSSTDDTKELARLIEISENLPKDTAQEDVKTVLVMEKADADAAHVDDSVVEQQIANELRTGVGLGGDPYKEIQNIYRTMSYLGASSQGPLYFEYIKRLEEIINQLPKEDHAIRNLFFTNAAIFYTRKKDYKKAIYYDQKLIEELNEIKKHYKAEGKESQDLDYFYYVSYRRMLRNFKGLTPEQIEDVYAKCIELAAKNEKAAEEFGNGGLTKSYYYMATKQYAKAVIELEKALNQEGISDFRRAELLGHLGYALRQTGDKNRELETLREYTLMLQKDRVQIREDMYREIGLRNSVNKVLADEYNAQEKQRNENRVMRKTSLTLVYVLAVILIFICQAYFRLRRKVKDLEARNNKLHRNIEHIFDDGVPSGASDLRHQKNRLKG